MAKKIIVLVLLCVLLPTFIYAEHSQEFLDYLARKMTENCEGQIFNGNLVKYDTVKSVIYQYDRNPDDSGDATVGWVGYDVFNCGKSKLTYYRGNYLIDAKTVDYERFTYVYDIVEDALNSQPATEPVVKILEAVQEQEAIQETSSNWFEQNNITFGSVAFYALVYIIITIIALFIFKNYKK